MNNEDDMYRHFIRSKQKSRVPQRKIYQPKYFSLMLTFIIVGGTTYIQSKQSNDYQFSLQSYILQMIVTIMAFLISSFSQFIGHRILYIISYTLYSVFFILIYFNVLFLSGYILFITSSIFLLQQINIQIYGMWPHKFGRIFTEFLFFQEITQITIRIIKIQYSDNIICCIFISMIVVNLIWLICGLFQPIFKSINDFKSPETDSVLKDFGRSLCNIKIIIFTLLYFGSTLSLFLFRFFLVGNVQESKLHYSTTLIFTFLRILPILSIILVRAFVNLNMKSSLTILISLILLVSLLIYWFILFEIDYYIDIDLVILLFQYFIWIVIFNLQDVFITPQYWQILLNIGIRNLDFVASYQILSYELVYLSYFSCFKFLFLLDGNNDLSLQKIQNFWIVILSLIGIIISLSFIFYQLLGFKKYLYNTHTSQVEEDKFYIEIN